MSTLTQAHEQWSRRAPDERFSSLSDMHAVATGMRAASRSASSVPVKRLTATAIGDDVRVTGPTGTTAKLTNWSFGQLATRADAPAGYLQTLPAIMAAECLNHGLRGASGDASLMFNVGSGGMSDITARAVTSDRYSRIWNADVTARLIDLEASGTWQPAPAAFDGSRGLYLGDRDMFAFMVDNERRIFEKLPGGGLSRGFFAWNSEVGAASFGIMTFLYEYVCGNHRVWGAQQVAEVRLRHVGAGLDRRAFGTLQANLTAYADSSATADELRIERMRTVELGANKDEILDALFNRFKVPKGLASQTIDLAEQRVDWYGNPRSVWGIAGALTEIGRDKPNADERAKVDRMGAKIMESVAF